MPRTKIDYSNTIIYKLCCKDITITDIYVGHSTDMRKRKNHHKHSCINEKSKNYNLNVYQFIHANGEWVNWDMIEIERYNAIDGYDAKKRERYWIEELKATLNSYIPTRTNKEYRENNKEIIAEKQKEWYENNKEIIAEKKKEWRENNKEYNKEWRENNKEIIAEKHKEWRENNKEILAEKHKEYYENNKEILAEKHKEYYENNKEILAEKNKEKITCECGCLIRKRDLAKHKRTKKHIELMTTKAGIQ